MSEIPLKRLEGVEAGADGLELDVEVGDAEARSCGVQSRFT